MKIYKEPWFWVLVIFVIIFLVIYISKELKAGKGITVSNINWDKRTFDVMFDYNGQKEVSQNESWYEYSTTLISSSKDKYGFIIDNTKKGSTDTQSDSTYLKIEDEKEASISQKKINWDKKKVNPVFL